MKILYYLTLCKVLSFSSYNAIDFLFVEQKFYGTKTRTHPFTLIPRGEFGSIVNVRTTLHKYETKDKCKRLSD